MQRTIDQQLQNWKTSPHRKPLLLRGARQVGKTHSVQQLGRSFANLVEVNFEANDRFATVFANDFDVKRIVRDLALHTDQEIIPGQTLLFLDEIQNVPRALTALRYFYEQLPELHVIAAGSLLDFTIQQIGIPVGRVASLYMYPLSFLEFLGATQHQLLAQALIEQVAQVSANAAQPAPFTPFSTALHAKLLKLLGEYLAIGGMPEAVATWQHTHDPRPVFAVHQALLDTYRQDFAKYATKFQLKYLETLFKTAPVLLGQKFKYSAVHGDYRKRELAPCVDLLATAGIIHTVTRTAGFGVPLRAEVDLEDFKLIFLDVGLTQALLGLDLRQWFLQPDQAFINKGALLEAFIGQELLAHAPVNQKAELYYWRRNTPGSEAEIDYLLAAQAQALPIEVKSGLGTTLKSMQLFLESHPQSSHGLRFSIHNYTVHDRIYSYPLYAVPSMLLAHGIQERSQYELLNRNS